MSPRIRRCFQHSASHVAGWSVCAHRHEWLYLFSGRARARTLSLSEYHIDGLPSPCILAAGGKQKVLLACAPSHYLVGTTAAQHYTRTRVSATDVDVMLMLLISLSKASADTSVRSKTAKLKLKAQPACRRRMQWFEAEALRLTVLSGSSTAPVYVQLVDQPMPIDEVHGLRRHVQYAQVYHGAVPAPKCFSFLRSISVGDRISTVHENVQYFAAVVKIKEVPDGGPYEFCEYDVRFELDNSLGHSLTIAKHKITLAPKELPANADALNPAPAQEAEAPAAVPRWHHSTGKGVRRMVDVAANHTHLYDPGTIQNAAC